jgi:type II secretory pathway predicted ATPase ExeA
MGVTEWFGLKAAPFSKNIASSDLYRYDQIEQLFRLIQATLDDGSMALVTGRAGTGKTTGLRGYLESLPSSKYRVVYVGQEQRGSGVIIRLLHELGAKTSIAWAHRTLKLTQKLQDTIRAGRHLVIVIDEAHLLEQQTLEDIRLLTNLDMDRNTGISVFLLGQHWLRSILKKVGNEALYQRLRLRLAMEGLTLSQTGEYIRHHLRLAGTDKEIFTQEAIAEIFGVSEGILREINNIAYDAMFQAAEAKEKIIDKAFLMRVLDQRELN